MTLPNDFEALMALRSAVVPGSAAVPSASDADPDGRYLREALGLRPDLVPALAAALVELGDVHDAAALDDLAQRAPDAAGLLVFFIGAAYFLSPAARAAVSFETVGASIEIENLDRLIEPVIAHWRP